MIATTNGSVAEPAVEPTPNDTIESLTGRRHLSWSQLSSYRGCPRRWFFSHVEGIEPAFVSGSLVLGSAIHAAIEGYYQRRLEGEGSDLDRLTRAFDASWDQEAKGVEIRYARGEDAESCRALGHRMLEAFLASDLAELPGASGDLIAIEETLTGPIDPAMPDLLARVDVMWRADDGLHLMDLKTSKSRWSPAKAEEAADQLQLYRGLASDLAPDEPVHLHFGVLTKAKSPAVQRVDVPAAPSSETNAVVDLMLPVWHGMRSGVDFASPGPMNCSTCGYRARCPAHPRK